MQLKETGAGEVTVWLAEMAVTMGATGDEEEAASRKEREGTSHSMVACKCVCTAQYAANDIHIVHDFLSISSCFKYTVHVDLCTYISTINKENIKY